MTMLYLLHSDGTIEQQPLAIRAVLDETRGSLICLDERGAEVARYDKLSVTMYSTRPFPVARTRGQERSGALMLPHTVFGA